MRSVLDHFAMLPACQHGIVWLFKGSGNKASAAQDACVGGGRCMASCRACAWANKCFECIFTGYEVSSRCLRCYANSFACQACVALEDAGLGGRGYALCPICGRTGPRGAAACACWIISLLAARQCCWQEQVINLFPREPVCYPAPRMLCRRGRQPQTLVLEAMCGLQDSYSCCMLTSPMRGCCVG